VNVDPQELLALSRRVRWDFPSSAGKPLRNRTDAEPLLERQQDFAEALRLLDSDSAAELAANVWRVWMVARDVAGGRAFLRAALDGRAGSSTRWRALALYGDGLFAWWQREHEASRRRNEEALEINETFDDPEALTLALLGLSRVTLDGGDYARARELAGSACTAAEPLGDAMKQGSLHMHAQAARLGGDHDEAAALFRESLELNRRIDASGMVEVELHNLGHVEIHRGNVDAAEECFSEITPSDDPYGQAMSRLNEATIAFRRGQLARARSLLDAAEATFADSQMAAVAIDDRFELDWLREQLACAAS
jgi:tetratricopeptide (TPR) repeat protein